MKKSKGKRASLSQGVLSNNTKNAGRNISKQRTPVSQPIVEGDVDRGHEDEDCNVVPRKITPSKVVCTDLPSALAELSLSDQDNKQTSEKTSQLVTEVLVTEVSSKNNYVEQETRSFTQKSPAKVIRHLSPAVEGNIPETLVCVTKPTSILLDESSECSTTFAKGMDNSEYATMFTKDTSITKTRGSKKKKYLPVQSRYMQQTSKDQTLELSAIPAHSASKESHKLKKGCAISHSTPYLQNYMTLDDANVANDGTILDTTEFKKRERAVKKCDRRKTCVSVGDLRNSKAKEPAPVSQLQMDLHYCRHLQMAYLHTHAKQTFEAQEQKAKEKIYAMSLANLRLKREIKDIEQKVQMKDAEMAADQLLRSQVDGLEDIQKKLPQLTVAMSQLMDAIKNTAKYMNIENVIIDGEKHMDSLEESKKLLSEITTLTIRNQPGIEGLSLAAIDLKRTVLSQLSEQKICEDLFTNYRSLVNQERSLQAQLIQCSNIEKITQVG